MPRHLAALPPVWAAIMGTISHDTGISIALFLGGVAVSAGFVWWARGKTDRWDAEIKQLKNEVRELRIVVYGKKEDSK